MVREAWTDERLDDLANRMDEGFRELRAELRQVRSEMTTGSQSLRGEIGEVRGEIGEVREELGEVRAEIKGLEKTMDARFDDVMRTMQIGFGILGSVLAVIAAMLVGVLGLIATQL